MKSSRYNLLVEGNNDKHVVMSLCSHYNVNDNFAIVSCDGVNEVLKRLRLSLTNSSVYERIGIVVDADNNLVSRWNSIKEILMSGNYDVSDVEPQCDGIVIDSINGKNKVGVWLMPNNKDIGMIEDFAIKMVDVNDVLMKKAETVLTELEVEGIQKYAPVHRSKAKIHSYLAWQKDPGRPIGQSITANVLDADSPVAFSFSRWLKRLFG